ncbi:MAG: hypothetical protein KIS62_00525 [Ramlibacter sp.]|nr:hypothetical protein [Ramlibacter sp.]MCW5648208.1 hypothetical protein [Ramlibacter sp.]
MTSTLRSAKGWPRMCLTAAVLLASAVAAGCSTVYAGKYNFADGWREGEIESIGAAASIATPQFSDCRTSMSAEQLRASTFALVKFERLGRTQRRVVPLTADTAQLRPGDPVYMDVSNCAVLLVRR